MPREPEPFCDFDDSEGMLIGGMLIGDILWPVKDVLIEGVVIIGGAVKLGSVMDDADVLGMAPVEVGVVVSDPLPINVFFFECLIDDVLIFIIVGMLIEGIDIVGD